MDCMVENNLPAIIPDTCRADYKTCILDAACVLTWQNAKTSGTPLNCGSNLPCTALAECVIENTVLGPDMPSECTEEYVRCIFNPTCNDYYEDIETTGFGENCTSNLQC